MGLQKETDLKRRKLEMGKEKPGDSDPNIHTYGKQETGKMGKSQYREAHGGCSIHLQQGKNRFWWFRNSFLSILSGPDSSLTALNLTM